MERREKESEKSFNVWLPLMRPLLGTWPTTQARALDWELNQQPSGSQAALNLLSQPHQPGWKWFNFLTYLKMKAIYKSLFLHIATQCSEYHLILKCLISYRLPYLSWVMFWYLRYTLLPSAPSFRWLAFSVWANPLVHHQCPSMPPLYPHLWHTQVLFCSLVWLKDLLYIPIFRKTNIPTSSN